MRKAVFFSVCIIISNILVAQQFSGHPPSTRWKQLKTDTVRVIFPAGLQLETQAAAIAKTAHALGRLTSNSIGNQLQPISIVLQPRTTISNGYVGLGPWRSEFYLTPRQNSFELGSLPWAHQLALHEYRHIQQYNNFNKGLSAVMGVLFGQEGRALANSAAVPNWFWEGDAVYQETAMSNQGRGRLPFFFNDYRSVWAAGKNYSWMKLRNGSLRDFVPDHYRLGYMMVAYGREKYGPAFWKNVTDDAVRFKGLFYPWQCAIKKYSHTGFNSFRKKAFAHFAIQTANDSMAQWAQQQRHFVADEEFPQWISQDEVVYVSSSYRHIPAFYIRNINTGKSRRIRTKDISIDHYFSYRDGKIVYAAYEPDVRWNWKDYSVIKVLDLQSGQQQTLTQRSMYFAPDIEGNRMVAVDVQPGGDASLHILDAATGALVKKLPNPQRYFYTYPKFYKRGIVSAIRNTGGEMTLAIINIDDGEVKELLPWSMNVIGFPVVQGDTICFTASYKGQDALFAFVDDKLYKQKTGAINSSTGNYQYAVRNGKAVWTAFTAAGYHMVQQTVQWEAVNPAEFETPGVESPLPIDTTAPAAVTRYSKSFRLFNFHSWRPFISDPDYTFSLVGENVLNTLQTELFVNYNRNEKFKEIGASLLYGGWLPYVSLGAVQTFDRQVPDSPSTRTWNETNIRLGLQLPFNFTSGRLYRSLQLSTGINTRQVHYTGLSKSRLDNRQFYFVDGAVSFTMQSQAARMHIYPRFGNTLLARYRTIVNKYTAHQWLLSDYLYLPGIAQTHNLVVNAAFQTRDTMNQYRFSNSFPFSRGYIGYDFPRMWKLGVNYHLPLIYPDWGFGNIVYFMRIRANAFYDYTNGRFQRPKIDFKLRSTGCELFFDTKWWNEYAVSFGIRYSRLLDNETLGQGPNQWELILPINLLGR
jgi:hypothetical protein